jgi:hypothetical protein|tara:strand:- start:396 stop:914 length:519 start_codon:yes stop_codon:yes gene_type:complete
MAKTPTYKPVENKKPLELILNTELVGINEAQVDQHELGSTKTLSVADVQVSGEIIGVTLISSEDGTGAILKQAADIIISRSGVGFSAGDGIFTIAAANASDGFISVLAGDWMASMNGTDTAGMAHVVTAFPFRTDSSGNLYATFVNRGAVPINSDAGDDEQVEANFFIRLDD